MTHWDSLSKSMTLEVCVSVQREREGGYEERQESKPKF